jgi:hypothetical protein|tara:strand:+ start:87 stop:1073 length:987 start_codon:yes stop_codon:yes gene_type:complete
MAILRGGKRIGGHDIRIGLPRDRSLDNVNSDPRLRQKAGGNPETTMGRFQAFVNEAEGFARKARFYTEFFLPKGLSFGSGVGGENTAIEPQGTGEGIDSFKMSQELNAVHAANGKRVRAFCSQISMPSRDTTIKEVKHGNSPARKHVIDFNSPDITATFYADKFMRERSYFELWQQAAFSTTSFNHNYYDNYVSDMNIYQLGNYASRQERDDITYGVKLFDCYPKTISEVEYSHENNNVQTFQVTFTFRYWVNYFIDRSGNIDLGQSDFNSPEVKAGGGLFGGLLNRLPPELRRAGRDVLNDIRRRAPIGRVTGGRVFPPFKIPPLNI